MTAASDRRPIRVRQWPMFRSFAAALARLGVAPNAISIFGMLAACAAGGMLACASGTTAVDRLLFAGAAALVQLRLLCNMLDGMVAIECGLKSPTGELFNEAPDRVSDVMILLGAGFATHASPLLGAIAALGALFVAYVRVLGRLLGLPGDYRGPMAKQERMLIITLACAAMAAVPASALTQITMISDGRLRGPVWIALLVIAAGCAVTTARRLWRIHALLSGRGSGRP